MTKYECAEIEKIILILSNNELQPDPLVIRRVREDLEDLVEE